MFQTGDRVECLNTLGEPFGPEVEDRFKFGTVSPSEHLPPNMYSVLWDEGSSGYYTDKMIRRAE